MVSQALCQSAGSASSEVSSDSPLHLELLLHFAGIDVQNIFDTLPGIALNTYDTAKTALTEYFVPLINTSYFTHLFRQ